MFQFPGPFMNGELVHFFNILIRFEWGNPNDNPLILKAMKEYSPYHNIPNPPNGKPPALVPACYISSGLKDSRVPFWEPLKFIAKLRTSNIDSDGEILMRVDKGGHFTAKDYEEAAEWMAFLVTSLE